MQDEKLVEYTLPGLHNALTQQLPKLERDTAILDIGCGTGAWLERLADLGFNNLYGVDLNPNNFKTNKATCLQADFNFEHPVLSNSKFGLITAIEVIEHLESISNMLRYVCKHLTDDGYFLLTTPNLHSLDCRLKFLITGKLKSFDAKGDPTHIYPIFLTPLQRILECYSLKIVQKWGYPSKGSLVTRRSTQIFSAFLELFLPNEDSGDTLCLLIQKKL